jgi:hypothetical protein
MYYMLSVLSLRCVHEPFCQLNHVINVVGAIATEKNPVRKDCIKQIIYFYKFRFGEFFFFFAVLGFELRPSPSATPPTHFCDGFFKIGSPNYLPMLASNPDPPDLFLLSSLDYRREPLVPG